jgi:hypothetical protein
MAGSIVPLCRGVNNCRFLVKSGTAIGIRYVFRLWGTHLPQIPQRYHANRLREVAESPIAQTGRWKGMFSAIAIALAVACVVGAYSLLRDALDEVW